mmetsp:Transcript_42841/g.110471  ORF Transcript_42841/g.110471 Transcript_42841/m.110471 type:complete len:208 (-) Transcript_42841:79-702(-)
MVAFTCPFSPPGKLKWRRVFSYPDMTFFGLNSSLYSVKLAMLPPCFFTMASITANRRQSSDTSIVKSRYSHVISLTSSVTNCSGSGSGRTGGMKFEPVSPPLPPPPLLDEDLTDFFDDPFFNVFFFFGGISAFHPLLFLCLSSCLSLCFCLFFLFSPLSCVCLFLSLFLSPLHLSFSLLSIFLPHNFVTLCSPPLHRWCWQKQLQKK